MAGRQELKFALLDADGGYHVDSTWGKRVRQLCEGAASNEHRFGVGWLESDGRVWFVHGPVDRSAATEPVLATAAEPARTSWCGIASADQDVALVWRDGSRLQLNFCGRKSCSEFLVKVPLASSETLVAFGCARSSCVFAAREQAGKTKLVRVREGGKPAITPLPDAEPGMAMSIVGAGDRAFAIAYSRIDGGSTIRRMTTDGKFTDSWWSNRTDAPVMTWAGDKLFLAFSSGADTIDMPR